MGTVFEAAAYPAPAQLQGYAMLPDGAPLVLRSICPEDEPALERLFFRLSPRTLYQRFFAPLPVLAHHAYRVTALAHSDPTTRATVVACDGDDIRGLASFDREAQPHWAELSILIEDAWQGRGLGKLLMEQIIRQARRQAITHFTVCILEGNLPAFRLVSALFVHPQFDWNGDAWQVHLRLETFTSPDSGPVTPVPLSEREQTREDDQGGLLPGAGR